MTSMKLTRNDYTVGWVCVLPKEQTAALAMLDCEHPALPKQPTDKNAYTLGAVGEHNVVIACLPKGMYGTNSAATVAARMLDTFPSIKFGLLVGIGAGIPPQVRLGDVVVSSPIKQYPGVVQWDFRESIKGGNFKRIGALNNPPSELLTALTKVESKREMTGPKIPQYLDELATKYPKLKTKYIKSDLLKDPLFSPTGVRDDRVGWIALFITIWQTIAILFKFFLGWRTLASGSSADGESSEGPRDMQVHYGLIASGNRLVKDSVLRDNINHQMDGHVLCLEMEAAGLANDFPCLVIRGICDYADSGKNKDWQEHAAAVAAAFAKELLSEVLVTEVSQMRDAKTPGYSPMAYTDRLFNSTQRYIHKTTAWDLPMALELRNVSELGKTILTSVVIHDIGQRLRSDGSIGIAYIYCNYRNQDDQKVDKILASLVRQLTERQTTFPKVIQDLYDRHERNKTWPLMEELSKVLQSLVKTHDRFYIIVDALDECQTSGGIRSQLLSQLVDLKENSDTNLFMTSRYMPDIEETLHGKIMKLEVRASEEDVGSYLDSRLTFLSELVKKNNDLRDEIRAKVIKAADGMFLLAELHVRSLEGMFLPNQIRHALETLPTGTTAYDKTYEGAMKRIESRVNTKEFAKKILTWIICARRPLETSELRHALAVKHGDSDLDENNLPEIGDIITVCAGLVVVDKKSNVVRLAHYTTQQYFERTKGDWFPNADTDITITCVTCLSHKIARKKPTKSMPRAYRSFEPNPLLNYVTANWAYHACVSKTTSQEFIDFLLSDKPMGRAIKALKVAAADQFDQFLLLLNTDDFRKIYDLQLQNPASFLVSMFEGMEGLHLATYFGMTEAVSALLSHGKDVNMTDHAFGRTPLIWAAMNGHMATVDTLLKHEADSNSRDRYGRTPLSMAAGQGHESIVSLLLATEGVDADSRDTEGKSPLYHAACNGNMAVFDILLSTGKVDINAESKNHMTPVYEVIRRGDVQIAERLLSDSNFNVNFRLLRGRTLLDTVAKANNENMVRLLLTLNEIQVDELDVDDETLLNKTASVRHEAIVKLPIGSIKADVNTVRISESSPLFEASARGHERVVWWLLESNQIHVNTMHSGHTALTEAIRYKQLGIVRLLLEKGKADVSIEDEDGYTPLSYAAYRGYESIARLLLEIGRADVDATDRHGRTPLQWAVYRWKKPVVWLLLEHGAEFDEEIKAGMKPLSESSKEDIRIVMRAAMGWK
uniref:Uncharacterized protein n=1 Tax=Gibberella zeae TaxID=5518 RepID=A0A4E9D6D4_GIBZA